METFVTIVTVLAVIACVVVPIGLGVIIYSVVKPIYPKCPHCDNKYKQRIPVRQYDQVTGVYTCETCGKVSYWLDIWVYQLR